MLRSFARGCEGLMRRPISNFRCKSNSYASWFKKKVDRGNYKIVEPGKVSKKNFIPDHIIKPSYYATGEPTEFLQHPEIKNLEQIVSMRKSCKLAANILKKVGEHVKVGQTTDDLDVFVHDLIISSGAYPSPLNYKHFPKSICTSINNVACHGIPDDRELQDGDIINVDITVFYKGYHGDCSKTFLIGSVDKVGCDLVEATEHCLNEAIAICKPGCQFRKIGSLIEKKAKNLGYTVVPAFIGHGIGHYFHGPPDIFHISEMQEGMTFTIEPVLTHGSEDVVVLEDGWTAVTLDFARTAQCEHTVLITKTGVDVLTEPL